jgi:hypothetical protein
MTAITAMKIELNKNLLNQTKCVSAAGYIRNEYKYKYQELVREAGELKKSISWLREQTNIRG